MLKGLSKEEKIAAANRLVERVESGDLIPIFENKITMAWKIVSPHQRPGDVLHGILKTRYGVKIADCKCGEWIVRMNAWGTEGCRDNIEEIVSHLVEEASTNPQVSFAIRTAFNVPIVGPAVARRQLRDIVMEAIATAETAPHKGLTQQELAVRLASPAHQWPDGWRDWPNVIDYHRDLLRDRMAEVATTSLPYHREKSRAILIPAGGRCKIYDASAPQFYFWGAYAAAWVLRSYGCTLPIEFWFLPGEMEEIEFCELHARRVAATCHVLDTTDMRCVHGWQVKINAILQSKHTQILHLDADNIVAKDPTYLFDSETFKKFDGLFWMDNPTVNDFHGRIIEHQWRRVGLDRTDRINDIETGQMLVDKDRAAKALRICKHFADHADYWEGFNGGERGVWYGDKTSFHMAFKLTGTLHHIQPWNRWDKGGFYAHCDPDGQLLFQHACHRKGHLVNGHAIHNLIGNKQIEEAAAFKGPLEFLDGSIDDALRCIAPEKCFSVGDHPTDREVWLDVLGRNEYLLGPTIPNDAVVIDIGANSGAFSYACLRRGAGEVVAFEPGPVGLKASANCKEFGSRFELVQRAVWRSDVEDTDLTFTPSHRDRHTGSMSAVLPSRGAVGFTSRTVSLDEVLRQHEAVHILKLDCEGAEFPILYTSKELHRVEHILGEYHDGAEVSGVGFPADGSYWPSWNIGGLIHFLDSVGFEVYRVIEHGRTHGNFWARRKSPETIVTADRVDK